jgi:hypothetical protein
MLQIRDNFRLVSSIREFVKKGLEPEAEEWPSLKPLPGNI